MKKNMLLLLIALVWGFQLNAQSGWEVRLLPQVAFGANNDLQRPTDATGTRFSLGKDLGRKNSAVFAPRVEVEYNYKRHRFIATMALLRETFDGVAGKDILYNEDVFKQGSRVDATYRFNTYRIGYRYRIIDNSALNLELGATILLRDAFISLEDDNKESRFSNVGVAPLLSYSIEWKAAPRLGILSYGDAFAVKAGRAIDVFAGARYRFSETLSGYLGYRLLEGGSDGERVYTMATYHFLSLGLGIKF